MAPLDPNKWLKLWMEIGAVGDTLPEFQRLCSAYCEPSRAYHNASHIADCLAEFENAKHLAKNPNAVELAIWYHDAIYDSKAKDNEERSAEMASKALGLASLPEPLILKVERLILATKHNKTPEDTDTAIMLDVDLTILGKPWETFLAYERAIRQEYAWVPENDFLAGRSKILISFLERGDIYSTDFFRDKYEIEARQNLRHSIELLGSAL